MISKKQRDFMKAILPRITIVEGCISSGKTFICNHKAIRHVAENCTGNGLIIFVGKTITTLERNVLAPLAAAYSDFEYSTSQKQASLCGVRIDLEGCNDIRAENKIRGSTAEFIYGDELVLWNKEFMVRCMGSLRTPNAAFLGTTNPDTPTNFVKVDYLDRKDELNLWNPHFMMEDNPSLTAEYIKQVSREYVGVLNDRFIKGLWVRAEGVIYRKFADDVESFLIDEAPKDIVKLNIGVDFGGNKSQSAFSATGFTRGYKQVVLLDEECRPAAIENPNSLSKGFASFVKSIIRRFPGINTNVFADSAEQILIRGLESELRKEKIDIPVNNAWKTEINDRIRLINELMGQDRFKMMRHCKNATKAFQNAVYDDKAIEDKRLDDLSYNMDIIDATEYSIEPEAAYLVR